MKNKLISGLRAVGKGFSWALSGMGGITCNKGHEHIRIQGFNGPNMNDSKPKSVPNFSPGRNLLIN